MDISFQFICLLICDGDLFASKDADYDTMTDDEDDTDMVIFHDLACPLHEEQAGEEAG